MSCVKQEVKATLIAKDGERFVGTNYCLTPQTSCPRAGMETGQGYHLCKEVCNQVGHAEVVAIIRAGDKAEGSVIYLEGHTYACAACTQMANKAGVQDIIIGSPPK